MSIVIPAPPSLEDALLRVSDLLRCAAATAYESGESLCGSRRDLAFSTLYLIDMAKSVLDDSLQRLEATELQPN
ncbi:hypothetical protein ASF84_16485 [Pseudomonas sp. Leaf127]|uniref:DUF6124 family protein n=2 Tax=Pseudomonas TaxID=286 RepID=UPI0007034C74|nr:DUF3077 domain-containing protein [Pseudomonas sp. Leaf127]KQQ54910.1 hypothetical protein ASF84_16485 [Pseudomonas sp. Leaf127]